MILVTLWIGKFVSFFLANLEWYWLQFLQLFKIMLRSTKLILFTIIDFYWHWLMTSQFMDLWIGKSDSFFVANLNWYWFRISTAFYDFGEIFLKLWWIFRLLVRLDIRIALSSLNYLRTLSMLIWLLLSHHMFIWVCYHHHCKCLRLHGLRW